MMIVRSEHKKTGRTGKKRVLYPFIPLSSLSLIPESYLADCPHDADEAEMQSSSQSKQVSPLVIRCALAMRRMLSRAASSTGP